MTALDKAALDSALAALLVINANGDIEADEVLARFRDLLDSYLNSTALADGEVPMKASVDGTSAPSGIKMSGANLMAPPDFLIESGGTQINDFLELNQIRSSVAVTDKVEQAGGSGVQYAFVDYRIDPGSASFRPRIFQRNEAENAFVASSDTSQSIIVNQANPLTFNYTATLDAQTNAFRFQVDTALVNARVRVTDVVSGIAIRYLPNQAAWISGVGGTDFGTGTQDFSFNDSPLLTFQTEEYSVEVRADGGAIAGSATDFPALTFMVQRGEYIDLAYERDTQETSFKRAVRVATTANITLSGIQVIDDVTLGANDRVLVKNQAVRSQNGIYVVPAAGAWTRATDADTADKLRSGIFVPVIAGTVGADSIWQLTTDDPITPDTTDLTFQEFGNTGATAFKKGVRVATTANITLSGIQVIDGITVDPNDRVLVKNQTDASENGIYVVPTSGAWVRATDADTNAEVFSGIFVPVSEGTTDADTLWYLTTNDPIVLGTTDLTFREFSGSMTTFNAPAITSLSISGLTDPTPPVGTALGGSRTLTFTATNTENIQGDLEFFWDNVSIAQGITATAGTAVVTIPATTTVAGVTHTGRLQGTNTQGATFTREVTFRSAPDQEQAYYGIRATDDFASVDVSTLTAVNVTQSGTVYNISVSAPNTQVLGILSPNDRDPVSVVDTVLSIDSIGDFTATLAVRTIGGLSYNLLTLTNNSGFTGNFSYTVTTE